MATGETGFDDVTYDLVSVQYHSLKAGHDYGQYVRDAKNAGLDDIASFFENVMAEDSKRATAVPRVPGADDQIGLSGPLDRVAPQRDWPLIRRGSTVPRPIGYRRGYD